MIIIVDYGLGNVKAIENIYRRMNVLCSISSDPIIIGNASKLILPGVGSFDWAMSKLTSSGLRNLLDEMVLHSKIPVLGICVGMQMMASKSEEGILDGLGWIDGTVKKIPTQFNDVLFPLPHMGWNSVQYIDHPLFNGLKNNNFYFLHSYYFSQNDTLTRYATVNYGIDFTCVVIKNNIFGVQFHPEKSHKSGIQLLKNFSYI